MNWYKEAKIDSFIIDYWEVDLVKTAGLKDWWKKNFPQDSGSKGLVNVTEGTLQSIVNGLWNLIATPLRAIIPIPGIGEGMWEDAKKAFDNMLNGISKTILGAAQSGVAGVRFLKEFASKAGERVKELLLKLWRMDEKKSYDSTKEAVEEKMDTGYGVPKWYGKYDFPDWYMEENKDFFNKVEQVSRSVEEKISDFGVQLGQKMAA